MRCLIVTGLIVLNLYANGQSDQKQIEATIQKFIIGTRYNYPDSILAAFKPGSTMFLYTGTEQIREMTVEDYAALYGRNRPGTLNNRPSKIIAIDQTLDVAFAKVQVDIPYFGNRYYDLLLLKKFPVDGWKIVSKCTSAEPIPKSPEELVAKPQKEVILSGLNRPWSMAFLSEEEAIIAEKDGAVVLVNLKTQEKTALKGLPTDVARSIRIDTTKFKKGVFPSALHGQERSFNAGWFQVLLDPDYPSNQYIYISYAAENKNRESATKVIRGILHGNELRKVEVLLEAGPYVHGLYHYGGGMVFGPDKKLYISTGERNFYEYLNPELPTAQDLRDKRGKILRLNSDGSIPLDNPDFGPDAIEGLYATGIRATQGFATRPGTNQIWFSEHGTLQGDELNILRKGANYGWPFKTSGRYRWADYSPTIPEELLFESPVFFWDKTVAPTGLTFYYGTEFPQWKGNLIVPGLSKGSLWRMSIHNNEIVAAEVLFIDDRVRLRKAIVSPRGQLYLLTDEENGKLIRVFNSNK